jgi:Ca2+-binding RTX toxin-like protein
MPKTLILGTNGKDTLLGGDGDELIYGFGGVDVLDGGAGRDELYGGPGADWVAGGAGDDLLVGGAAGDFIQGGAGIDTASYAGSAAGVRVYLNQGEGHDGDAEGDKLIGIENLVGSSHNDGLGGDASDNTIEGGAGDDHLSGGDGNDVLRGGADDDWLGGGLDADVLDGGTGSDGIRYYASAAGVTVNLATGTASGGDADGDVLISIEKVSGSTHDDVLTGDDGNNWFFGHQGSDVLQGNGGADIFAFKKLCSGLARAADRIMDFSQAEGDLIDFSMGGIHPLVATTFIGDATFSGASGEVRYEQTGTNTWVSVDTNGDAAADFQLLCVGTIDFTAADFML